jgi:hypothetical protein
MRTFIGLVLAFAWGCSSSQQGTANDDGGNPFGSGGAASDAGTGCGTVGSCAAPDTSTLAGEWVFALAATLGPTKPILFRATVSANGASWQWTLVPLNAKTRLAIPGPPIVLAESSILADATWSFTTAGPIAIPAAANPLTGSDIEAGPIGFTGQICGGRTFYCGDVTGQISKPISLDLNGSHWTLARAPSPGVLPEEIFVDCTCRRADPPQT